MLCCFFFDAFDRLVEVGELFPILDDAEAFEFALGLEFGLEGADLALWKYQELAGKWAARKDPERNEKMRGFLVAVPEPGSSLFGLMTLGVISLRRRRRA